MFDRFWWWCNRKPSREPVPYLTTMFCSFVAGIIAAPGILLIAGGVLHPASFGLLGVAVGLLIWTYVQDARDGCVKACHHRYLAYRRKIGRKLGKI